MTPDHDSTPGASPGGTRRDALLALALFGGIFLAVLALVVTYELDPSAQPQPRLPWRNGSLSHKDVIALMMALSGLGAVGTLIFGLLASRRQGMGPGLRKLARGGLVLVVLLAGLNYFYARQGLYASQYAHRWDTFHYLLGPRYYAELDYADLYACALETLNTRQFPDDRAVRDLRTYRMKTAGEIRALDQCEGKFSPERWARFEADMQLYKAGNGLSVLRGALEDRGYNGTPFHSAVGGYIADRIPLTQATHALVPMLDIATLCLMGAAVAWGFGWEVGLVFALFFFTNAADRFGIIGSSFFRYQWLVTLVLGLVALRRQKHALAGFFLALSTLLNVFPVVFAVGVFVRGLVQTVRQRRVPVSTRRFFVAAVVTGLLGLGVGALPARGLGNYTGFQDNMEMHNVERFQGFGTGLKFPFIFRGAVYEKDDKVSERTRKGWFHDVRPWYYALATLVIGMALGVAARTDDDVEAAAVVGFTLFFGVLGTVGYYFAVASVMVLALHRRARTRGGVVLLSLFFVTSFVAHAALYETLYYRFMYNTALSTGWSIWLLAVLSWLTWRLWRRPGVAPAPLSSAG